MDKGKDLNKKLEKILVVEDNKGHIAEAKDFFKGVEGVNVNYASTFSEAVEFFGQVDGVITDIYLPIGNCYVGRTGDEDPIGLLVAASCHMRGLPFVFCTAGYHHGIKYNWINQLQRTMRWPEMIDASSDKFAEADHKPWDRAYETLKRIVENKSELC